MGKKEEERQLELQMILEKNVEDIRLLKIDLQAQLLEIKENGNQKENDFQRTLKALSENLSKTQERYIVAEEGIRANNASYANLEGKFINMADTQETKNLELGHIQTIVTSLSDHLKITESKILDTQESIKTTATNYESSISEVIHRLEGETSKLEGRLREQEGTL